jgi:hypothetical protein
MSTFLSAVVAFLSEREQKLRTPTGNRPEIKQHLSGLGRWLGGMSEEKYEPAPLALGERCRLSVTPLLSYSVTFENLQFSIFCTTERIFHPRVSFESVI